MAEETVAEETVAEETGVRMWCGGGGDPTSDPLLLGAFLGPSRQVQWVSSLERDIHPLLVCTQNTDINLSISRQP